MMQDSLPLIAHIMSELNTAVTVVHRPTVGQPNDSFCKCKFLYVYLALLVIGNATFYYVTISKLQVAVCIWWNSNEKNLGGLYVHFGVLKRDERGEGLEGRGE